MKTVAEQIGGTPHLSPLLHRLRSVGMTGREDLRRLAVARGCEHYRQPGDALKPVRDPGTERVSDLELAMAMLSAAQGFDPVLVRCAAQLLSGEKITADVIARLAVQERSVPVLRHIARAGLEADAEGRKKWERLLVLLPGSPEVPEGRLPHRSRFVSTTGITRRNGHLDRSGSSIWLRTRVQARME